MKVLLLTLEYPPQTGGIASYTFNMAAHLPVDQVVVLAPHERGDREFDQTNKWKTIRKKLLFRWCWPRWFALIWQVFCIIRTEKIETVHIHHLLPGGYAGLCALALLHTPYVIFLHGTDLEMALRKKRISRYILDHACRIVANSEYTKQKLESHFDISTPIGVLHPAPAEFFFTKVADEKLLLLRRQLALEGKKVVLSVGRLSEGKGFPHSIRLLPQIVARIPNLTWLFVGDGEKKDFLSQMVQEKNLQNTVRFLGKIPYQDLPSYYQIADLFVLLTHKDESREEGWGTVFLEAEASGLPVVAGRVGGVEETVIDRETGILVDTYQDTTVVNTIIEMLNCPVEAKKMGECGRKFVKTNFRWSEEVKKII